MKATPTPNCIFLNHQQTGLSEVFKQVVKPFLVAGGQKGVQKRRCA